MRRWVLLWLFSSLLATVGCLPDTTAHDQQVEFAVQATLHAMPSNTPPPVAATRPAPTAATLSGIFCEYRFCIGHPSDMAFYDVSAARNQLAPSSLSQGFLAAYNASLVIQVLWQDAPGSADPQFMLDLIMQNGQPGADTRSGSIEPKLVGPLNVFYLSITPTSGAVATLPYGGAAAWLCGGRAFAWKAYTPQPELALTLMTDALTRFRCESQ